ncbi:conserved exported hypothetical protein [Bradyrhizobium sp. ORS 375]|uniref:hypothetical protein n=1 Tax=Bradyrhizobium sp. (strain ORS 375) TaxID=566679 RepID=UPI0002408041|nr:hypothetical protein [Bradyrhizobium sp. ORS 375]CCD93786.1 conserved exported hypothetical protein [Bradyrhizobium sp. ORS 375]
MFELAFLTTVLFIAAVALTAIYQRRQDVLYGPYITDAAWPQGLHEDGIETSSS